jgi:DegV family protein with EDD domain
VVRTTIRTCSLSSEHSAPRVIHVVTDSTSDLTRDEAADLGVTVVPLVVRFGDDQFRDGVDLTSEAFYRRLAADSTHPTTSQPSPEEFTSTYESLLRDDEDSVVGIHISAKLSGTLQSAHLAVQQLGSDRIHLVDSETVSGGLQLLVRAAVDDIRAGNSADAVAAAAKKRRAQVGLYVLLDTLEYLQRGGRIGRAQAFLGGLLNVKPLLTTEHGEVAPQTRVRSRKRGLETIVELLRKRAPLSSLAAFHTGAPELIDELRALLSSAFPGVDILVGQVGPVVGTYTGPGGVGVAYLSAG